MRRARHAEVAPRHFCSVSRNQLDGAPIGRLGDERRCVRCGGGDEIVALLARFLATRGQFGEMPGSRGVRFFACPVETLPERLGNASVLLVERFPFVAQFLDVSRDLCDVGRLLRCYFSALAQLEAGVVLAERLPALELDQLLGDAAEALQSRLR
jgi:hypothetical protein